MKRILRWENWILATGLALVAQTLSAAEVEPGFRSLFNGADLTGWEGKPGFWSVKDGVITGQTTRENPLKGNTFLVWTGGTVADFELRLSYRIEPNNDKGFANSGVQYRSKVIDPAGFVVGGYQGDMEAGPTYSGILYEERGRGIMAQRGQKVVIHADGKKEVVGSVGDSAAIQAAIKPKDWNDYVIIAQGNHLQHFINGRQTVDVTDEQTERAAKSGVMALQLHAGEPMTVQFKDIRIKTLSGVHASSDLEKLQGKWQPASLVRDGDPVSKSDLAGLRVRVEGNRYFIEGDADTSEGTFELVEGTSPKAMNITTSSGDSAPGIFEVTDDTLKVCYPVDGGSRPSAFKSDAYSGRVLAIYRKAKQSDLDLIQGPWRAVSVVRDGETIPKADLTGLRLRVEGKRFFIEGDPDASGGTFELVEGTSPKGMDVTTSGGDMVPAIYEITGDTLKVCYATDGGSRPSEFKSAAYSGRVLAVYGKAPASR